MLSSARRTFTFFLQTPLIPPPAPQPTFELSNMSSSTSAGPSRPVQASRTFSSFSAVSLREQGYASQAYGQKRGYASDKGKKELYSDEGGAVGAGVSRIFVPSEYPSSPMLPQTDDVAHTEAAFDSNADPSQSAKKIQKETGKDYTKHSPAQSDYSQPPGKQGKSGSENPPLNTSNSQAKK
ncbi:hypothetical protein BD324DRAFT_632708 [Kockovaella imperatae]|uniref:Uncharacterized protein n=1 Tax=Kockovaella imperatae TaxID=4999 RepID=A0A1Y1UD12_9TREE|nr:hypothetical protein BD324DRAFT_632708 [Kockovaella imperatae]ORX35406.1 hypothetical protein BD324DRAFT_632708 [Kockovaella imperatae]